MDKPVSDLQLLLRTLSPELHEGVYVFASTATLAGLEGIDLIATFRETEGWTLIAEEREAERAGLEIMFRAAWITLTVHSDLNAVGLTAAFATALGAAGISCNVVAAAYHDHIFVPVESAEAAMATLRALQ